MTTLSRFIKDLHESGRVVVPLAGPDAEDPALGLAAARQAAAVAARAAPGRAPDVQDEPLLWGFATLFQAARFLAHRDLGPELLAAAFAGPAPAERDPGTIFAVDVGLRHLPTVAGWVRAAASADPLLAEAQRLGRDWPLSSVGMAGVAGWDDRPLAAHPTLVGLYTARIIASGDSGRAAAPWVRAALAAALGDHPSLAPTALIRAITSPADSETNP